MQIQKKTHFQMQIKESTFLDADAKHNIFKFFFQTDHIFNFFQTDQISRCRFKKKNIFLKFLCEQISFSTFSVETNHIFRFFVQTNQILKSLFKQTIISNADLKKSHFQLFQFVAKKNYIF